MEMEGCPDCSKYQGVPSGPHVISTCSSCGREIRFVRPGEHGLGIKIEKGDKLTIPKDWLTFSFNPLKSRGTFTRAGLEWFAKKVFLHGIKEDRSKEIALILEEYKREAEEILRTSPLLTGYNIDDESQGEKISELIQANKETKEWWAFNTAVFVEIAKDALRDSDINTAAWAVKSCEQCRMMVIFKNELEEVIWMGQGAKSLITLLQYWYANKTNSDEGFWQKILTEHAYALSQIFSVPVVFMAGNAYVGGQKISREDSNFVDFIYQNDVSGDSIIFEIKTPATRILGRKYRKTYSINGEVTGSIVQASNYRLSLIKSLENIKDEKTAKLKAINPKSIIIAGNASLELDSEEKLKSWELFRGNLKDVFIVTYDELFRKIEILCQIFRLNAKG